MAVEYYVQESRCCALQLQTLLIRYFYQLIFIMTLMIDTLLPADSLEFCPSPGFHDIFVCGTYKLEELSGTRRGQCLVFKVLLDSESKGQLSWCAFH